MERTDRISSELFSQYVGISEEQLAYELYMNEDQIETMQRHGMFIGVHGYDHYALGKMEPLKMREDIDKALKVMDGFIDRDRWVMNYPYGSYNEDIVEYIRSKGASAGFVTKVNAADISRDEPLKLPRLNCNDFPPKSEGYKDF